MTITTRVAELLLRWEELREQGQQPTPEELCAQAPELREEVRRRLAELGRFRTRALGATSAPCSDTPGEAEPARSVGAGAPTGFPAFPGYAIERELGRGGMGVATGSKTRPPPS